MISPREFIEDEFAGVEGVRAEEFFKRASDAGLDPDELERALSSFPARRKKHRLPEGAHIEWKHWRQLSVGEGLMRLLGYSEWSEFFVALCEAPPGTEGEARLQAQAWQFRDELKERGVECAPPEVKDALLRLVAEFFEEIPAQVSLNETQVLALARALEVSLDVDPEKLEITAAPEDRVTPELREAIRENRDDLIRQLLFSRAMRWTREKAGDDSAAEAFEEGRIEFNEAWRSSTCVEFRDLLRKIAARATKKGVAA